jgi:hypothetical protein
MFERDFTAPTVSIEMFSLTVTGRKEKRLEVRPDHEYYHIGESVQLPLRCPMSLRVVEGKVNSRFGKGVADGGASFDMKVLTALDPSPHPRPHIFILCLTSTHSYI